MVIVAIVPLKLNRKEMYVEKVVVVQAEATSTGANTVGIVEIRLLEVNHSLKFGSTRKSTGT